MADPVAELRLAVEAAADSLLDGGEGAGSEPTLERPTKPEFGDYSTNGDDAAEGPALPGAPRARTIEGLCVRIATRLLTLAACIALNHRLGRPSRALVDYVA